MIYEGVPNNVLTGAEPDDLSGEIPALRHYLGASASQTISTQSMDSLLGIKHSPGDYESRHFTLRYTVLS